MAAPLVPKKRRLLLGTAEGACNIVLDETGASRSFSKSQENVESKDAPYTQGTTTTRTISINFFYNDTARAAPLDSAVLASQLEDWAIAETPLFYEYGGTEVGDKYEKGQCTITSFNEDSNIGDPYVTGSIEVAPQGVPERNLTRV